MASKEQRDAAIQGASSRVSSGCMYCGDRTAEVEALRAERDRYRQGLIDIARYEGWQSEAPAAKAMGDIARRALTEADL